MNPIRTIKILRRAQALFGLFEEASVSKSLFTSKTFWFNVVTAVAGLLQVIPMPPEYAALSVGIINVVLRLVTDKPVHVA